MSAVEQAFEAHRSFLWGLGYRLTGNAADAEDIVQETFVRALQHPPARTDEPWRPWLVRVAVNLGRDLLRRRRRRDYVGPWLPSPVPTPDPPDPSPGPSARYDLAESVTIAFLLALEALTPTQRAVLLLRDVFDYSVAEAAAALGMSEGNVRVTHLRARRTIETYDRTRQPSDGEVRARTQQALEAFLGRLAAADVAGVEALLARDVRALSDGGGEFHAARAPIDGREKVARLYVGLTRTAEQPLHMEVRMLNGLPAVVVEFPRVRGAGWAPRVVIQVETDDEGHIRRVYAVLASAKLAALGPRPPRA